MKYLILIISIWLANNTYAQNIKSFLYDQNSGLDQSYIYTLLQDDFNHLWIGTQQGLYTYNGKTFEKFTENEGLVNDLVISSFRDSKGKLYFGHFNGALTIYHNHEFDTLRLSDEMLQPIAFLELEEVIYVLTRSHGIYAIDEHSVNHYLNEELNGKIASHFTIFNRKILISHHEGILTFDPNNQSFAKAPLNDQLTGPSYLIKQKFDSGCWVWSEGKGLMKVNKEEELFEIISKNEIPLQPEFIFEDDFGYLWLGSKTGGLVKLEPIAQSPKYKLKNILQEPQINSNKIGSFFQDHEGNYWAGSLGGGLLYLKNQFIKNHPVSDIGKLHAIIPYQEDQFIMGTEKGAYYVFFDPESNEWQIKPTQWLPEGIAVTSLYQKQETIYIGTENRGIFTLKPDGSIQEIPFNHMLKNGPVRRIIQQDSVLFTAVSGQGFFQITTQVQQYSTSTGFLHNEIYDMHLDHRQQLWIAMHANGLSVKNEEQFHHLTISEKIEARDINSIIQDEEKNIWIATPGYGLYKYDTDFNLIKHFSADEINSNYGFFLLKQGKYILLGTPKGVDKINTLNDSIEHVYAEQSSSNLLPVINGAAINKHGDILILNSEGFQVINHQPEKRINRGYKLILTNFKIFNQNTAVSKKLPGFSFINISDYLKIKPHENHLNIEFLNISFANPDQMTYSYMLDANHAQWSEPGKFNQVTYPSLNPGTYYLQIKSSVPSNSDEQFLTVKFVIPTPFYLQWWFLVIASIFFMGLTASVYYIKNRNIRQQNKKLEKLVEERTFELQEINDELLTTQEDVQHKNKQLVHLNNTLEGKVKKRTLELKEALTEYDTFLYNASHALKGPVARLIGLTSLIKMENPDYSLENFKLFNGEHDRLIKILSKLTAVHTIFNCKPERLKISLLSIIDAYFIKTKPPFSLVYNDDFQDQIYTHPDMITIIMENLLENAIMFCKSDHSQHVIRINSRKINGNNLIEIFDSGIGIEEEVIPHIFKMYYRGSAASKGNGLGLYLVKKGLDKINGSIEVESQVMKYTCIKIILPA